MNGYDDGGFSLRKVVKWLVIGLVAVVALRLALVAAGMILQFGLFALVRIGPILLVGWLVLKLLRYLTRDPNTAA